MTNSTRLRGVEELISINSNNLRISNSAWGSRLVDCGNGEIKLYCGASAWGYAAELELAEILDGLDKSKKHYLTLTLTVLQGDISIGIVTKDDEFISELKSLPRNEKLIVPVPVDFDAPGVALMIRNGGQPYSMVRIHKMALERTRDAMGTPPVAEFPNLDRKNADFWSELCGSKQAKLVGISDFSPRSLKRFDEWYFNYYPHLFVHIPFTEMEGLDVLEVGLGYGTVSQRLAEWGARFVGLDITPGAVDLVNGRLHQAGLPGEARVGSILDAPFENESFDRIVTIGCLHHTGDLARSIDECWRILRPGGQLVFMVYNAYSLRRWVQARGATAKLWLRERLGYRGPLASAPGERTDYDTNEAGEEAPHLDVVSVTSLRHLCRRFTHFAYAREHILQEPPFAHRTRNELLKTFWPRVGGTDIYVTATKSKARWYRYAALRA